MAAPDSGPRAGSHMDFPGLYRDVCAAGGGLPPPHYYGARYPAAAFLPPQVHSGVRSQGGGGFGRASGGGGGGLTGGGYGYGGGNKRRDIKGVGSVVGVRYGFGLGRHAPRVPPTSEAAAKGGTLIRSEAEPSDNARGRRAIRRAPEAAVEPATTLPALDLERVGRPSPIYDIWHREALYGAASGYRMGHHVADAELLPQFSHTAAALGNNSLQHLFTPEDIPAAKLHPHPPYNSRTEPPHPSADVGRRPATSKDAHPRREEVVASASPRCVASASDDGSDCEQQQTVPAVTAEPLKKKRGRKPIQGVLCRVPACRKSIGREKMYYFRRRMCEVCLNQQSVVIDGREVRFCQQCSQLHPMSDFDGMKRSCRSKLESHKVRAKGTRRRKADSG